MPSRPYPAELYTNINQKADTNVIASATASANVMVIIYINVAARKRVTYQQTKWPRPVEDQILT